MRKSVAGKREKEEGAFSLNLGKRIKRPSLCANQSSANKWKRSKKRVPPPHVNKMRKSE